MLYILKTTVYTIIPWLTKSLPVVDEYGKEVCSLCCREIKGTCSEASGGNIGEPGTGSQLPRRKTRATHGYKVINYYPKCPNPELTFGLPAHSDHNVFTLLLQDDVPTTLFASAQQWTLDCFQPHSSFFCHQHRWSITGSIHPSAWRSNSSPFLWFNFSYVESMYPWCMISK